MTDVAASISPSSLTALLALTPPDSSSAMPSAAGEAPFAALMTSVAGQALPAPQPLTAISAVSATNPIAALLASTAAAPLAQPEALPAPAVLPTAVAQAKLQARSLGTPQPIAGMPASENDPAATAAVADEQGAEQTQSDDPLGDAIATGATAVLALAPAIMQPILAAPVQFPVDSNIPAAIAESPARAARSVGAAPIAASASTQLYPATPGRRDPVEARTGTDGEAPPRQTQQPAAPAAMIIPDHVLKAVLAKVDEASGSPNELAPDRIGEATNAPLPAKVPNGPGAPAIISATAQQSATIQQAAPARAPTRVASDAVSSKPGLEDDLPAPGRSSETTKLDQSAPAGVQPAPAPVQAAADTAGKLAAPAPLAEDNVVQQTLSIARDGAWLDRLARDIAGSAGDGNQLHFRLNPENLGALSVSISRHAEGASVRLTTDSEVTRNILLDAQPNLVAEARAQGLHISDAQVELSQTQPQGHTQNSAQEQPQKQGQSHAQSQTQPQNQGQSQDSSRWAQGSGGQNAGQHNGQNRHSSPAHQPFVSNLGRKSDGESERVNPDSNTLYA